MPEYFELTFFSKKKANKKLLKNDFTRIFDIKDRKTTGKLKEFELLYEKEFVFEIFSYSDFYEIVFSIPDLVFTKKNFDTKAEQLRYMVNLVFENMIDIKFATGIYETTSYILFTKYNVKCLFDITNDILANFPFLFFKNSNEYKFKLIQQYENISCVLNSGKNVQDIFSSPVSELMENEGMNFEEAHKKLYGYDFAEEYAKRFDMSLEEAQEKLGYNKII